MAELKQMEIEKALHDNEKGIQERKKTLLGK
jgi:hypothetical protein